MSTLDLAAIEARAAAARGLEAFPYALSAADVPALVARVRELEALVSGYRDATDSVLRDFGDEYEGRLAPLRAAHVAAGGAP